MLAATWVLAVATSVLALGIPVAFATWLGIRRTDRVRQQREHEDEFQERILERARKEFVASDRATGFVALAVVATILGWVMWSDRKQ